MANYSMDDLKVSSETDLFSTISKSDYSWKYKTKTFFNNSKQLKNSISNICIEDHKYIDYYKNLTATRSITTNHMLKTQNTNAPWLFNVLKKKFHRSRKYKNNRIVSNKMMTDNSKSLAEELLEKPINRDGISGKWIVNEKEIHFPLMKNFDTSTSGQYNASRAISSSTSPNQLSTNDSFYLHHYQYDFQTLNTPTISTSSVLNDHPLQISTEVTEQSEEKLLNDDNQSVNSTSVTSIVKNYSMTNREETNLVDNQQIEVPSSISTTLEPITEDVHLINANSTIRTTSKRAKSTSAAAQTRRRRRTHTNSSTKRRRKQSTSTRKKKLKSYEKHLLTPEEIELREALRLIDLDNIGFFPPTEFRRVLKEIGINSNDIDKIERCLPLDEDGHYSVDNLVKLLLSTD